MSDSASCTTRLAYSHLPFSVDMVCISAILEKLLETIFCMDAYYMHLHLYIRSGYKQLKKVLSRMQKIELQGWRGVSEVKVGAVQRPNSSLVPRLPLRTRAIITSVDL